MRIMAVSDRVLERLYDRGVGQQYPGVELIVGCGDLPYFYLDFLTNALDAPLAYVRGNHDAEPQYTADGRTLYGVHGGLDLHLCCVLVGDLLLAGLQGSRRYRPDAPLTYTEAEMAAHCLRLAARVVWKRVALGRRLDILVTHSPPRGVHDANDLPHRGFRALNWLLRLLRPRYLLHGHTHIYRSDFPWRTQVGRTTVINVYPMRFLRIGAGTD
ncbi:MAG: metallophosphoesterase family protein [Candidatus Promineifilaceae bacterium]